MSDSTIFVGGAGGISSWLVLFLARASARVVVIDMDTVGAENIAGQLYGEAEIGMSKVKALKKVVGNLCMENNITSLEAEVTEEDGQWRDFVKKSDAVCVGFDNLKARGEVYKEWLENGKDDSIFIDGRLSAESGTVYVLLKNSTKDQFTAYEQTYFPESERVELPCTMKATSHCGSLIASLMTAQITNHFNNITEGTAPRDISNIEFHLPLMIIEQPILKVKEDVTFA